MGRVVSRMNGPAENSFATKWADFTKPGKNFIARTRDRSRYFPVWWPGLRCMSNTDQCGMSCTSSMARSHEIPWR
jgi:hypothetical protein